MNGTEETTPCKVLLVDDEENILRSISRLLMEEELEILTAGSGEEGIARLQEESDVALVLSDQRMPGLSGAEFLEKARELAPDAVRMVLTGYADINATMDAINRGGASRYITKPWDDELLLRAVREGVGQYRMLMENRRLNALVERQNAELAEWNGKLKGRVLEQTATIRRKNEELSAKNQQIGDAFRHTIVAFSRLIELHSPRLKDHTRNVTELSVACCQALKLSEAEIETVRTAALLHDIGVIGIDSAVIAKKPDLLSPEELFRYRQHSVRGQSALDAVEELRAPALLIRHHHERFDGDGFPDRLAKGSIPLGARILAFADFVDFELAGAHTEAALEAVAAQIRKEAGGALDPGLVETMLPLIGKLYGAERATGSGDFEREYKPRELTPGMEITRNLYSGTGLLLLTAGTVVDEPKITSIMRYYNIDRPTSGIFARKPEQER